MTLPWTAIREQSALLPAYLTAHLQLTLFALVLGSLVSIPIGVLGARSRRLGQLVLGVASVLQTVPSLALLAFLVPCLSLLGLRSIGVLPALIGLFVYSLLPILRNTVTALSTLDPAYGEAARGVGMTPRQQLLRVELPIAAPAIVAGIRTAAVWTVGTATLATPVGAVSLGNYIFGGLQTRNFTAVVFGCVAAAALALVLDGLIHLGEAGLRARRRGPLAISIGGLGGLIAIAVTPLLVAAATPRPAAPIRIGSKTFTEQYILGRILAGHLTAATQRPVQVLDSLGSTVAFEALRRRELDAYVDYSGTLWMTVLKRSDLPRERGALLSALRTELSARYGIELLAALGFENAYALAMRRAEAQRLGITRLSQLAAHAPALRIGSDYEFFERSEWSALKATYGFRFASQRTMDPSLLYEAVRLAECEVITAYSSDGRIASYGLELLTDDRGVLLPYDAVILARPGLAAEQPEVARALRKLEGSIELSTMQKLNAAVDKDGESPAAVAARFLRNAGYLQTRQ